MQRIIKCHSAIYCRTTLLRFSSLKRWGVRISPQSRLIAYGKRLQEAFENQSSEAEASFLNQLIFDLREIDEIIAIVSSLNSGPTGEELNKLKTIAKGSEHPDEEVNSKARDTQYELYLKTVFNKAGIVTRIGEPDLLILSGSVKYPVAAKRPKSPERLDDRLHDAVRQLKEYDCPGIIAISLAASRRWVEI